MNRFLMQRMTRLDARARDLEARGEHPQAMTIREELCDLARDHFQASHPWLCARLLDLAASYRHNGELGKAEATYDDVLNHLEAHRVPGQLDLAQALNTVGVFKCETDRPHQAIVLFQQALDLTEHLPGQDAQVATLHNNLASSYHSLGVLAEAKDHYLKAMEILGHFPVSREKAYCLCDLAELLTEEEDDSAIGYLNDALEIFLQLFGQDSHALADAKVRLADLYCRMAETERAMTLLEEAASVLETSGRNDVELAQCLDLMSRLQKGL